MSALNKNVTTAFFVKILDAAPDKFTPEVLCSACRGAFPFLKEVSVIEGGVHLSFQYNANHSKVRERLQQLPVSVISTNNQLEPEDLTNLAYLVSEFNFLSGAPETSSKKPAPKKRKAVAPAPVEKKKKKVKKVVVEESDTDPEVEDE